MSVKPETNLLYNKLKAQTTMMNTIFLVLMSFFHILGVTISLILEAVYYASLFAIAITVCINTFVWVINRYCPP